jgi:hypothetical protein
MPISYERNDSRRRMVVTLKGAFQTDDVLAIMARQRVEHTWTYGILYDLRGMTGQPTFADLGQIMSQAAARRQGEGPHGPVALLATEPTLYRRLCKYAALGRSTRLTIEVFRRWDEAQQWLTVKLKGSS